METERNMREKTLVKSSEMRACNHLLPAVTLYGTWKPVAVKSHIKMTQFL